MAIRKFAGPTGVELRLVLDTKEVERNLETLRKYADKDVQAGAVG